MARISDLKKGTKKRWVVATIILLLLAAAYYNEKIVVRYSYKAFRFFKALTRKDIKHGKFQPIEFPYGYRVHGVDISRWQDEVDFYKLRTKTIDGDTLAFKFAFIKATEGILLEDPMFEDNWENAKDAKIVRGAYHYYIPSYDPKKQARNFITSVKLERGDMPPVVDVEEIGKRKKSELVKNLKIFIAEIEKKYGVKPIIYSNISFIEDYLADDFSNYKFWIAHYYEEELVVESSIKWLFWQHTDKAFVFGSNQLIDANVFNGNEADFKKILIR